MRTVVDWSYGLLGEHEQQFLRSFGIFAGGFTVEAAAGVATDGANAGINTIDRLADLVAKSLVVADVSGTKPRFRLFDTTRTYALEKLNSNGEHERIARRHAEYYLTMFKRAEAEVPVRPTTEWLADHGREIDNLRAALDWAFSRAGDASLGVALTTAAVPLWLRLSLLEECGSRADQALRTLKTLEIPNRREEMKLHAALGASLAGVSEVVVEFTAALDIAKALDDTEYQLRALRGLYVYNTGSNRFRAAFSLAQRFHELATSKNSQGDQVVGERMLGVAKFYMSDLVGARRHLEQALDLYAVTDIGRRDHRIEDVVRFQFDGRVEARAFLTRVLWLQGLSDQAIRMAEKCLEEARATGHVSSQCFALALVSCPVAFSTGNLAAADYTRELVDLSTKHSLLYWTLYGARYRKTIALRGVNVDASSRRPDASVEEIEQSVASLRPLTALTAYVEALAQAGRRDEGLAVLDEAAAHSSESGPYKPELLRLRGELLLLQAVPAAAGLSEDLFRQALAFAHQQGELAWELRAATSLARLLRSQSRPADAIDCLRPVYDRFTEGFGTADLIAAKQLLDELSDAGRR
jgi:predicted ATPase